MPLDKKGLQSEWINRFWSLTLKCPRGRCGVSKRPRRATEREGKWERPEPHALWDSFESPQRPVVGLRRLNWEFRYLCLSLSFAFFLPLSVSHQFEAHVTINSHRSSFPSKSTWKNKEKNEEMQKSEVRRGRARSEDWASVRGCRSAATLPRMRGASCTAWRSALYARFLRFFFFFRYFFHFAQSIFHQLIECLFSCTLFSPAKPSRSFFTLEKRKKIRNALIFNESKRKRLLNVGS